MTTHIDGINITGSRRASDLELKLHVLRGAHGERVATFATATFVTNSIAELYVMQRYLQPGELDRTGLSSFDAWAATFGRTVTGLELAPDGGSYRFNTRFARFVNVPELLTLFAQVADVRTAEQLALPTPTLAGDTAEVVVVPASSGLETYVAGLVERAEKVRSRAVGPEVDNMLKVTGDGRKAALDLRLVDVDPDPDGGKITAAAERIAHIWDETRSNRYADTDGEAHPRPGSFQLVFCDLSTPSEGWNAYDELKTQLAARGLSAEQVRFIHEAGSDKAKAELFAACRDGRVNVLVGSTEKMGVGTNVQARAVALHHLDCPWRPTDIEQREGRLLRQGNQNLQVQIVRYVTEGSFDVFMWQTVERKSIFIHQVTRGEATGREIDDIGDQALSFAQVKALATGNPLIMERAGVEQDVTKLERLARTHQREQHDLTNRQTAAATRAERLARQADQLEAALSRRVDTRADRFAMTVGDDRYTSRVDAGVALRAALLGLLDRHQPGPDRSGTSAYRVGEIGGFGVDADITRQGDLPPFGEVRIEQLPIRRLTLERADIARADPVGLATKIENRVLRLEQTATELRAEANQAHSEATAVAARIGRPFEHHERLRTLRTRLAQIDEALTPADPVPLEPGESVPSSASSPGSPTAEQTVQSVHGQSSPRATPDPSAAPVGGLSVHARHQLYEQSLSAMHYPPPTLGT